MIFSIAFSALIFLGLGYYLGSSKKSQHDPGQDDPSTLYAIVEGKKILARDVQDKTQENLKILKKQEYFLKKQAVEELLIEKKPRDNSQTMTYSEEEFDQYLAERKINFSKLSKKAQQDLIGNFKIYKRTLTQKKQQQNIEWFIPMHYLPGKTEVAPGFLPDFSNQKAKKKIVVFANYHCPFCPEAFQRMKSFKEKFQDQVSIQFRFSLEETESSIVFLSALASGCAKDQSKLSEMHEALFTQAPLSPEELKSLAEKAGLKMPEFNSCLESKKYKSQILADTSEAEKRGINRQAMIYVNGYLFEAQEPFQELEAVLNQ